MAPTVAGRIAKGDWDVSTRIEIGKLHVKTADAEAQILTVVGLAQVGDELYVTVENPHPPKVQRAATPAQPGYSGSFRKLP
jgi:hypothetical protein